MKILITGTTGLSAGLSLYLKKFNIYAECITVRDEKWKFIDFGEFDALVHVAGLIPKKDIKPEDFYSINRDLTISLAHKAKDDGVKHFIFISSMAVYNVSVSLNQNEGIVTTKTEPDPQSDYGRSKFEAELGLAQLKTTDFRVACIRAPSIYGENAKTYLSQYELIVRKFKLIPNCYRNLYRSAIYTDNLYALIRMIIINNADGVFCPDDGLICTADYCQMIAPRNRKSWFIGKVVELFLSKHPVIKGCYGQVAYDRELTEVFEGKYRVCKPEDISEKLKSVVFNV